MAGTVARITGVPVPIRELWNAETCPVALLPWLAWTLSVEAWNPEWPEYLKRSVISGAIKTARVKGTKQSVIDALEALGANAVVVEWFEKEPAGVPHTFEVNLVGNTAGIPMQNQMIAEIRRTKPLRSHFTVNFGVELAGSVNTAGVLRVATFQRMDGVAEAGVALQGYTDPSEAAYLDPGGTPYQIFISL